MPWLLKLLAVVGTAAMLWVGGSIIVHSVAEMGWHTPEDLIKGFAKDYGGNHGGAEWSIVAAIDFVIGLVLGLILIPIGTKIVAPLWGTVFGKTKAAH